MDANDRPAKSNHEIYLNFIKTAIQFVLAMAQYSPYCTCNNIKYLHNNSVNIMGRYTRLPYDVLFQLVQNEIADYFPKREHDDFKLALRYLLTECKVIKTDSAQDYENSAFYLMY